MTSGFTDHETRREIYRLQKRIDDIYILIFLILSVGVGVLLGLALRVS